MSDKSEGPGWWIASDGKWYPPELHPSVRDDSHAQASASSAAAPAATATAAPTTPLASAKEQRPDKGDEGLQPHRWQGQAEKGGHVGPQFPDLFKKAMQGSHLADNVSVKYDGDDERNTTQSMPTERTRVTTGGGSAAPAGTAGVTFGAPSKRKWRKGH